MMPIEDSIIFFTQTNLSISLKVKRSQNMRTKSIYDLPNYTWYLHNSTNFAMCISFNINTYTWYLHNSTNFAMCISLNSQSNSMKQIKSLCCLSLASHMMEVENFTKWCQNNVFSSVIFPSFSLYCWDTGK